MPYKLQPACLSRCFPVIPDCPTIQHHGKTEYGAEVGKNGRPTASFKDNHAHHFHEVTHRIQCRYGLRPAGHTIYRGEQSAHEDEHHHEEKHDKHGLLLGVGVCGNQKAETEHRQQIHPNKSIHGNDVPFWEYAVDHPRNQQAEREDDVAQYPEGDKLAEDEVMFFDRCYVDLFNSARFFFLHDIQCR